MLWKRQETVPENISGQELNLPTASGTVSIKKYSISNGTNISIRYSSEPNITTTRMISIAPQSKEICFSITTKTSSPEKITIGISSGADLTSWPLWTSPTAPANDQTSAVL